MPNNNDDITEYVNHIAQSREATIAALYARMGNPDDTDTTTDYDYDYAREELDALPLSIESDRLYTVVFGTGGPHDEMQIVATPDGYIKNVTYHAFWGGDTSITKIYPNSALYRYAEEIVEYLTEAGQ